MFGPLLKSRWLLADGQGTDQIKRPGTPGSAANPGRAGGEGARPRRAWAPRIERLEGRALLARLSLDGEFIITSTMPANFHTYSTDLHEDKRDTLTIWRIYKGFGDFTVEGETSSTISGHTAGMRVSVLPSTPDEKPGDPVTIDIAALFTPDDLHREVGPLSIQKAYTASYQLEGEDPVVFRDYVRNVFGNPFQTAIGRSFVLQADFSAAYTYAGYGRESYTGAFQIELDIPNPTSLSVTAEHDDEGTKTDDVFGLYLENVPLPNTFTVQVQGDAPSVATVELSIDGLGTFQKKPDGNQATFADINMGSLRAGEHELTARALGGEGQELAHYSGGKVVVTGTPLDFELQTTYPGGPADPIDVEKLRFLAGISLPSEVEFRGTLKGIPDFYQDRITKIQIGGKNTIKNISFEEPEYRVARFRFLYDPGLLAPGLTSVIVPISGPSGDAFPFDTEKLLTIDLPLWMGTPTSETFDPAVPKEVFGDPAGAYVVRFDFPKALQSKTYTTSDTPLGLFNGLDSFVGVGAKLVLYARPTIQPGDAVIKLESLFARATLLGQDLVDEKVTPEKVEFLASLDAKSLGPVDGVTIRTKMPIDLIAKTPLFDVSFGPGGKGFSVPIPASLAANASLSLTGKLKADVDSLKGELSLKLLIPESGPVTFDKEKTYVAIATEGGVLLNVGAGVGFDILGVEVAAANVTVAVYAHLYAKLVVGFDGNLSKPSPFLRTKETSNQMQPYSEAALAYGYGAAFNASAFKQELVGIQVISDPQVVPLFGLGEAAKPDLKQTVAEKVKGAVNAASKGFSGVEPTEGDDAAVLGDTSEGSGQNFAFARSQALDVTPPVQSVLPLAAPLFAGVERIAFDLNVLAGRAALTPGRHSLAVVLVGPDGEVPLRSIDLAGAALVPNLNPLGFTGGWTTFDTVVPEGALELGVPYLLEFRLESDESATGERVAAVLDRLVTVQAQPALGLSSPTDDLSDGRLDFTAAAIRVVHVSNDGTLPLHVGGIVIEGGGFAVLDTDAGPFVLYPGETTDRRIQLLGTSGSASATLRISSDDPTAPALGLPLLYDDQAPAPVNHSPVLSPLADVTATVGQSLRVTAAATDPDLGQELTYSLDAGAPVGTQIDPLTGVLTWFPTAAGTFHVTVRATDNGTPALSNPRSFTIEVSTETPTPTPTTPTPTTPTPTPTTPTPSPSPTPTAPPLTVVGLRWETRKLSRKKTARVLVVSYSGALDPGHTQDPGAYRLAAAGKDKKLGTRDDKTVPLASATYDPVAHTVTLALRGKALPNQGLQFSIGAGQILDTAGRPLDGDRDGREGSDFTRNGSSRGISAAGLSRSGLSSRVSAEALDALAVREDLFPTKNRR